MEPLLTRSGQRAGVHWTRVTHGVHRPRDAADPGLADLHAWLRVLPPGARFTHLTAARLWGLWLPPLPGDLPVVAACAPTGTRPRRPGLHVVRPTSLAPPAVVAGLPVDPVEVALLTACRHVGDLDALVMVDSALATGLTTPDALAATAAGRSRGAPRLRRVLARADVRTESPWETVLRDFHRIVDAEVEPQFEVTDDRGHFVARGDLRLTGHRVLHEYDGGDHLTVEQQRADLRRLRRLAAAGWVRRGYTSEDLVHRATSVLRDVDLTLGRPHDPGRVRPWHAQLRASCFTRAGQSELLQQLSSSA
ncbi:hypothetical protein [Nocardioides daphniae]|uniref:DUF559 domain-containing protein n=1 Tax=Nocardioides daphniae TaxID=402297 RepID=A0A4P7UDA8_9ACTN|nr:hypothetical protein [Nocardioides daphniae]QCC78056.1 hypothetical protein E2C04_14250 [Nocardioides daphniae]GGD22602.1 hypothetical protein GCM10007231_22110 [Nocardioides daphniae]